MARTARRCLVRGRVQGVGFRWAAEVRAVELGLAGWVRNLPDGGVEAWIEGEAAAVEAMLAWLARGPPAARVTGVEVAERAPAELTGFVVRRSGV